MMHLCLLRDGITPLRSAQHSHSHPAILIHLLTPSAPISLQRGQVCLIIDLVHNHCLLAACQEERWHRARPQTESKSLCGSSSTSSTGPRCRTFTYTERLSNLHWQPANTEHLQQLLLSASSSNTHRRESSSTHFLIGTHTFKRAHRRYLYTIIRQTESVWQQASNPLLVQQTAADPWCQQMRNQFSLMMSALFCHGNSEPPF